MGRCIWLFLESRANPPNLPGDNEESGIVSTDPSDATISDEVLCPDDYLNAPTDQIRCVSSLDHDVIETFDLYPAEIPLSVQIMSRILEDRHAFRFSYFGDFLPQITISKPSVSVVALFRRVLYTCCTKFVLVPDKRLSLRMKLPFVNSLFETRILLA
jgi:hypothetical protein